MERKKLSSLDEDIKGLTVEAGFERKLLGRAKRLKVGEGVGILTNAPGGLQSISRFEENRWNALKDGELYTADGESLDYVYEKTSKGIGPRVVKFEFFSRRDESLKTHSRSVKESR